MGDVSKQIREGFPKEFNPRIHGPYCPWRNYGKVDVNFWDVKLQEMPAWLMRRNFTFRGIMDAAKRRMWQHQRTYLQVRNPGLAWLFHLVACASIINYFCLGIRHHDKEVRPVKYMS